MKISEEAQTVEAWTQDDESSAPEKVADLLSNSDDSERLSPSVSPSRSPSVEVPTSGRDARGRFASGNTAAMTHGARSESVRNGALLAAYGCRDALIEPKVAAIITDLGGPQNVATVKRALIENFAGLANIAEWQLADLAAQGLMTKKGRTRATFTSFVQTVDRLAKLASQIGIERQAREACGFDPIAYAREGK